MNIGAISSYVALVCLLTFLAITGELHAQTTTQSTVMVKKAKASTDAPVIIQVNGERTSEGGESNENVITISKDGKDGQPRKLVVQRTVINGKETILLNGKEVNEDTKSLPADVEKLLEDIGDSNGKTVIKLNGSTMTTDGVMGENKLFVWNSSPKCNKVHVEINGLDSLHSMNFMNSEEMKKRCEEMKQQLGNMKANMNFRMDTLRTQVWTTRNGEFPMHFRVMDIDSAMSNGVFIYKEGEKDINVTIPNFDFDFDFEIPDMPVVREFETDDLGDIETMFDIPEPPDAEAMVNAPNAVQKRYKVIIIEHPSGHDEVEINDNEAEEGTSDEPSVVQPSLPSTVNESNTLKAEYFNVFPNPTPGTLNISFALQQSGGPVTVTVTDLMGSKVFDETLQNYTGQYHRQIDLADKARGTYIVSVTRDGQTLARQVAVR